MPIIHFVNKYRKIPRTSPGPIFVQKAFLVGLFSGVEGGGLILEGVLRFKMVQLVFGRDFASENGFRVEELNPDVVSTPFVVRTVFRLLLA